MVSFQSLERKFGKLAAKKGFATKRQVHHALKEQKHLSAEGESVFLGDILVQREAITEQQKDTLLEILTELRDKLTTTEKVENDNREKNQIDDKRVQNGSGYELIVTADRMTALICPQVAPAPETDLASIKDLLALEHISYGVVADDLIVDYLTSGPSMEEPLQIAQGKQVRPGRPPEIKYHFETNPLKAGTIDKSGAIDFKNRGKIPQVEEGTVIAEIIPSVAGVPGNDVYGDPVAPPEYDDVIITSGNGVRRLDGDLLKFVAQTKGRPELLDGGTLCVSDVLTISGDIGIETGHVEFDGHIEVTGSVSEGYRVKGKTINADEIFRADVEAEGDITVAKGIIGATIRTDGAIKARHIRDSVIDAIGDVNIETEAYECNIETNGAFNIEHGTILCSKVSAMKGITAGEIGTDGSAPCELIVGVDNRMENQISLIKTEICEKKKEDEALISQNEVLQKELNALEDKIGELAQQEDGTKVKGNSLNATFEKLKEANDRENIIKVLRLIKHVNLKLDQMKTEMGELLAQKEQLENKIRECTSQINESEARIQELREEIVRINELAKTKKSCAILKVSGTIYGGATIQSPNASFSVKKDMCHITIQEVKKKDANVEEQWDMIVSPLK